MWKDDAYLLDILIAARKVSSEFKAAHPEIPWAGIVGLRNRLIHEYFRIIPDRVWEVVSQEIDPLIDRLEPLVPPDRGGD